ncbi:unnamed protein product [Polarella glacialis]|uniref:AB hydrolase-1 domain-containing protein n=1 Tax=Polarella glacialis TaxID=89957 RepID=A0A813E0N2_POLGL|nr:unnamed protein product [Polarella glacialis]
MENSLPASRPVAILHAGSLRPVCAPRFRHSATEKVEGLRVGVAVLFGSLAAIRKGRPFLKRLRRAVPSFEERLSAEDDKYELYRVPVRDGSVSVGLKCFLDRAGLIRSVSKGTAAPPPVLLVHDGPGLPSRYLEPLSTRLRRPAGRVCFLYDQLGCGLSQVESKPPGGFSLEESIKDLKCVLEYICTNLGEDEVHLLAHGFGGVIVMEGLLKGGLGQSENEPRLQSICLLGVPACTHDADSEARRLMSEAVAAVGIEDAAQSFWFRHVCAMRPQPSCLADAYSQSGDGAASAWRGFGALRGWDLQKADLNDIANDVGMTWKLRGPGLLKDWKVSRPEVAEFYSAKANNNNNNDSSNNNDNNSNNNNTNNNNNNNNNTSHLQPPLLSLRGEHDFVTTACMAAWRGVKDAAEAASREELPFFREQSIGGCGHNAHLENPEAFAAQIRLWFLDVEERNAKGALASEVEGPKVNAVSVERDVKWTFLTQSEARQKLQDWASELSWKSQLSPSEKPGAWRSVGQGMPHNAASAPSRSVRRLAEWARQLPAVFSSSQVESAEAIARIQEICAIADERNNNNNTNNTNTNNNNYSSRPCLALGLLCDSSNNNSNNNNNSFNSEREASSVKAIVCVEAQDDPASPLRIVGAAAAPDLQSDVLDDAVRQVTAMLFLATRT